MGNQESMKSKSDNQCQSFERPTWVKVFEAICAFIGIVGLFIVANGSPTTGFAISIIASILFIVYNAITKQWALLLMSTVYLAVEIYGIYNWMHMQRH